MTPTSTAFLLTLYITIETTRAHWAYHAFHTYPSISAPFVILLSELLKLIIALIFILYTKATLYTTFHNLSIQDLRKTLPFTLPAALYLINNLIYYTVLPLTSPTLLQICVLAKLPTTGVLYHYWIKRQRNVFAWISLAGLCSGLIIFNIPSSLLFDTLNSNGETAVEAGAVLIGSRGQNWWLAPLAGFVIAILSAIANIFAETSTKIGEFWDSQALLFTWGVLFSALAYPVFPSINALNSEAGLSADNHAPFNSLGWNTDKNWAIGGLVGVTATMGLVVAVVLRTRDNILKVVGIAGSLVAVAGSQFLLMPDLRKGLLSGWKIGGGGMVVVCTWCYHHYSHEAWTSASYIPKSSYLILPNSQPLEEPSHSDIENFLLDPSAFKTESNTTHSNRTSLEKIPAQPEKTEGVVVTPDIGIVGTRIGSAIEFEERREEREMNWLRPDATKIVCAFLIVAWATYEAAIRG